MIDVSLKMRELIFCISEDLKKDLPRFHNVEPRVNPYDNERFTIGFVPSGARSSVFVEEEGLLEHQYRELEESMEGIGEGVGKIAEKYNLDVELNKEILDRTSNLLYDMVIRQ